ncbi:MAG: hypothetical protein ITD38_02500 [Nitrosospira sp.]|nr:hypothetical protein [Nitrosospira sp.]
MSGRSAYFNLHVPSQMDEHVQGVCAVCIPVLVITALYIGYINRTDSRTRGKATSQLLQELQGKTIEA